VFFPLVKPTKSARGGPALSLSLYRAYPPPLAVPCFRPLPLHHIFRTRGDPIQGSNAPLLADFRLLRQKPPGAGPGLCPFSNGPPRFSTTNLGPSFKVAFMNWTDTPYVFSLWDSESLHGVILPAVHPPRYPFDPTPAVLSSTRGRSSFAGQQHDKPLPLYFFPLTKV